MRTLIKDGTVVTSTDARTADVWIDDGTIVAVADAFDRVAAGVPVPPLVRFSISADGAVSVTATKAQIEAIDGSIWSTDRRAVSIVKVNALPEASLRVAGKDLPAVV